MASSAGSAQTSPIEALIRNTAGANTRAGRAALAFVPDADEKCLARRQCGLRKPEFHEVRTWPKDRQWQEHVTSGELLTELSPDRKLKSLKQHGWRRIACEASGFGANRGATGLLRVEARPNRAGREIGCRCGAPSTITGTVDRFGTIPSSVPLAFLSMAVSLRSPMSHHHEPVSNPKRHCGSAWTCASSPSAFAEGRQRLGQNLRRLVRKPEFRWGGSSPYLSRVGVALNQVLWAMPPARGDRRISSGAVFGAAAAGRSSSKSARMSSRVLIALPRVGEGPGRRAILLLMKSG
jgi:hypothetical protein